MLKLTSPPISPRRGAMSKGCLGTLLVIGLLVLALGGCVAGKYNGIVSNQERVEANWSKVESDYKHRSDTIPQLVETVKGATDFERSTLEAVVEARNQATKIEITPELLNDEAAMARFFEAQDNLTGALSKLFALSEDYPELKAVDAFLTLQDQIEGLNNRINVSRKDYIEAVRAYNTGVKKFPGNLIARAFGFESMAQFKAEESAMETPVIDFGTDEE